MELVYLWVEDYKNIKNQGFNFSPRFECEFFPEYEKDTEGKNKLKDDCKLEIKKKDDYVSIFPKNINVTAIVGENGSGKSSVLERIYSTSWKMILIIFENNQFKIYSYNENLKIINKTSEHYSIDKIKIFPQIHFSWDILHYEPVIDIISYGNGNPNILLSMLGTFQHPEYIDLHSYKNNSVVKYIEIFIKQQINIFSFSPNKINIQFPIKKTQNGWDFEDIKKEIKKLRFPKEEAEKKKEYFETISKYVEKYLKEGNKEKSFTLEEYKSLLSEFKPMKDILCRLPSLMLDIYDDNDISFFSLSHGERSILLSNALLYEAVVSKKEQNILLCLDEPDLSLHPEWQKKYINELVKMFSKIDKKFHFLITSHSPFILSDIPKENVIFLEKGKQVDVDIETFGANIHTLLSHGFFMEDGLMGEFAKSKINEIIEFHKKVEELKEDEIKKEELKKEYIEQEKNKQTKKEHFWNIQSIIGEEYLKQVIKNHLIEIEKILLGKDEAKKLEVDRLKKQIKLLEKSDD